MVRSLSQWTKTLSFPNRHSKECNVNVHPIQAPPTPARNKTNSSTPSSSPPNSPSNVPITEISQIVSNYFLREAIFTVFLLLNCSTRSTSSLNYFCATLLPSHYDGDDYFVYGTTFIPFNAQKKTSLQ